MHYFKTTKTNILMFSGALKAIFFFFGCTEMVLPGAKIHCVLVAIKTSWHWDFLVLSQPEARTKIPQKIKKRMLETLRNRMKN